MCTGKSTIARLLAERLELPHIELDEIRWDYYQEAGYEDEEARRLHGRGGTLAVLSYCKPFELHAVERVLEDHPDSVIDFGAGHSVQDTPDRRARLKALLAPHPNIFLPLPSPEPARCVAVLTARFRRLLEKEVGSVDPAALELNVQFIQDPANASLAKHVIYTESQTPEQTCQAILTLLAMDDETTEKI